MSLKRLSNTHINRVPVALSFVNNCLSRLLKGSDSASTAVFRLSTLLFVSVPVQKNAGAAIKPGTPEGWLCGLACWKAGMPRSWPLDSAVPAVGSANCGGSLPLIWWLGDEGKHLDHSQTGEEGLSEIKLELRWLNRFEVSLLWEAWSLCKCEKDRKRRSCLLSRTCGRFLLFSFSLGD